MEPTPWVSFSLQTLTSKGGFDKIHSLGSCSNSSPSQQISHAGWPMQLYCVRANVTGCEP